jgi:hypothetical protein
MNITGLLRCDPLRSGRCLPRFITKATPASSDQSPENGSSMCPEISTNVYHIIPRHIPKDSKSSCLPRSIKHTTKNIMEWWRPRQKTLYLFSRRVVTLFKIYFSKSQTFRLTSESEACRNPHFVSRYNWRALTFEAEFVYVLERPEIAASDEYGYGVAACTMHWRLLTYLSALLGVNKPHRWLAICS